MPASTPPWVFTQSTIEQRQEPCGAGGAILRRGENVEREREEDEGEELRTDHEDPAPSSPPRGRSRSSPRRASCSAASPSARRARASRAPSRTFSATKPATAEKRVGACHGGFRQQLVIHPGMVRGGVREAVGRSAAYRRGGAAEQQMTPEVGIGGGGNRDARARSRSRARGAPVAAGEPHMHLDETKKRARANLDGSPAPVRGSCYGAAVAQTMFGSPAAGVARSRCTSTRRCPLGLRR